MSRSCSAGAHILANVSAVREPAKQVGPKPVRVEPRTIVFCAVPTFDCGLARNGNTKGDCDSGQRRESSTRGSNTPTKDRASALSEAKH